MNFFLSLQFYLMFEVLSAIYRASIFYFQQPENYFTFFKNKTEFQETYFLYLTNIVDHLKKTVIKDLFGRKFFNVIDKTKNGNIKNLFFFIVAILLAIVFSLIFIYSLTKVTLIINWINPYDITYTHYLILIITVFIVKAGFSVIFNFYERSLFLFKLFQNYRKSDNLSKIFKSIVQCDVKDTEVQKALSYIVGDKFVNDAPLYKFTENNEIVCNKNNPIYYLAYNLNSDKNTSRYLIYLIVFCMILKYSAKTTSKAMDFEFDNIDDNYIGLENEQKNKNVRDIISKVLYFFSIFSMILVSNISFLFLITSTVQYATSLLLDKFIIDYKNKSNFLKTFYQLLSVIGLNRYINVNSEDDSAYLFKFTFLTYFLSPFIKIILVPILFIAVFSVLTTIAYILWYESDDQRIHQQQSEDEDVRSKRTKQYVKIFQSFIVIFVFLYCVILFFNSEGDDNHFCEWSSLLTNFGIVLFVIVILVLLVLFLFY